MIKNILSTLYIIFLFSYQSEAQERRVLLQEKGITLFHYVDYNKPFKHYAGEYPYTNLFCIEDNGKIDTISIGFANPVGKAVFNGTQLAFEVVFLGLSSRDYSIYEKVDGTWRYIAGAGTGSIYPNGPKGVELTVKSMFVIDIKSQWFGKLKHTEVEFDVVNRKTIYYDIDDNNNKKFNAAFPFRKGRFPKFISRN